MTLISRFTKDDSGATAIEYGLLASLIAIAIITAATALGSQIAAVFDAVTAKLKTS